VTAPRYIVKAIRGMCIGAGAFVVVDTQDGSEWGMTLWREEAEKLAARWNAHAASLVPSWADTEPAP